MEDNCGDNEQAERVSSLGISWRDHVTNEEILKRTKMENLQDVVKRRR